MKHTLYIMRIGFVASRRKGRNLDVEIWTDHIGGGNRELFGALVADGRFHLVIPKVRKSEIKGHSVRTSVPNVGVCQLLYPNVREYSDYRILASDLRTVGLQNLRNREQSPMGLTNKTPINGCTVKCKNQSSTSF